MLIRSLRSMLLTVLLTACLPAAPDEPGQARQALVDDGGTDDAGAPADLALPPPPPSARLRAMTWQSGGFTIAGDGFFDKTLNTRCAPARAADGVIRCIPYPWVEIGGDDVPAYDPVSLFVFTDSSCTNRIIDISFVRPMVTVGDYVRTRIARPIGSWFDVYRVGPIAPIPSTYYRLGIAGGCYSYASIRPGTWHSVEHVPTWMLAEMSLQ